MPARFPNEMPRNRKASEMTYWPAASPFGEESHPRPFGFAYEAVAVRGAKQFVEGEDILYVKAVARAAFQRTKGGSALHAPDPILLKALPSAAGEFEAGASHVQFVHEEMAWNRERWSILRNSVQWRRYGHEAKFLAWLESVPLATLLEWTRKHCLARGSKTLSALRGQLVQLVPMPSEIARAYFVATTPPVRLRAMAGLAGELSATAERHVCLICHRLLAFHAARHSRHGPAHVNGLVQVLSRWQAKYRAPSRSWPALHGTAQEAILSVQGRVGKEVADLAMGRIEQALHQAQNVFEGRVDPREAFQALNPNTLTVTECCSRCEARESIVDDESALPPFHPTCRCIRLAWRSDRIPELERKVSLWALECAFAAGNSLRFPCEEILECCCKSLQA